VVMTLPPKNVPLVECLISRKGSGNDEAGTNTVHARIQARSGAAGRGWPEHCRGGRTLGVVDQTLYNWVKAQREGKLKGADSQGKVNTEQMGISRLRAELARVKMARDILGKATAYFAK
jgi:transposase-like protein